MEPTNVATSEPSVVLIEATGINLTNGYDGPDISEDTPQLDEDYLGKFRSEFYKVTEDMTAGLDIGLLTWFPFHVVHLIGASSDLRYTDDVPMYTDVSRYLTQLTNSFWCTRAPAMNPHLPIIQNPKSRVVLTDPLQSCRASCVHFNAHGSNRVIVGPSNANCYQPRNRRTRELPR